MSTRKKSSVEDLREMWQSLYALGDEAMARMKAAADSGDWDRIREASAEWDRAWAAIKRMRPVSDAMFEGMKFRGRKPGAKSPWRRLLREMHRQELENAGKTLGTAHAWREIKAMAERGHPIFKRVDKDALYVVSAGGRQRCITRAAFNTANSEEASAASGT